MTSGSCLSASVLISAAFLFLIKAIMAVGSAHATVRNTMLPVASVAARLRRISICRPTISSPTAKSASAERTRHVLIASGAVFRTAAFSYSMLAVDDDSDKGQHVTDACAACSEWAHFDRAQPYSARTVVHR